MNDISFLLSAKDVLTAEAYSEMLKKNGVDTITERLEPTGPFAAMSRISSTGGSFYGSADGSLNKTSGNSVSGPANNTVGGAFGGAINTAFGKAMRGASVNSLARHAVNSSANNSVNSTLSPAFCPTVNLYVRPEQLNLARDLVDEFDDSPVVFNTPAPALNQKSPARQLIFALVLFLVFVVPIGVSLLAIISRIIRAIK